jgi:restriction endonuclease S subunit
MIVKLHEITEIKTGITFRNRLLDNLDGDVEVIQMKDVDSSCNISDRLIRISSDNIKTRHYLQPNQIILLAKGKNTRACLITEASKKRVISSAFFSLKIKQPQQVLPYYLQWFLNLPQSEEYFKSNASGTSMFSLPMSVLKNLDIALPTIDVQKKVIKIVQTRQQEKTTLYELEEKKDTYIQQLLMHQIFNL